MRNPYETHTEPERFAYETRPEGGRNKIIPGMSHKPADGSLEKSNLNRQ
jgi:hypothetical protein